MANRICILRGVLKFNDPCSAPVVEALRAFALHPDQCVNRWQFPNPGIEIGDKELRLTLYVRGRVGYRSESIEAFAATMCPLTCEGSHLELIDTEYPDGVPQLYWIGPNEKAWRAARVDYGLALAKPFLESAIGEERFAELRAQLHSFAAMANMRESVLP